MNLRVVEPYYHTSRVFSKQRWIGRTLLDVITNEFKSQSKTEHQKAVDEGRVYIERKGNKVEGIKGELLRGGDILIYRVHWHEPPVNGQSIKILEQNHQSGMLVIDKPGGIPTHPSGKYRYNSLTEILGKQIGTKIYASHRLDRLTSGLMVLATTSESAAKLSALLREKQVRKEYIAKVVGEFPDYAECDYEIYDLNSKLPFSAISKCIENAKPAKTSFKRLSFDGETSIVHCFPETGRMHQIRKHLAILGHPIANDELYRNREFKFMADLIHSGKDAREAYQNFQQVTIGMRDDKLSGESCPECGTALYEQPRTLSLWLHAYKYYAISSDDSIANEGSWCFCAPDIPFS